MHEKFTDDEVIAALRAALPKGYGFLRHEGMSMDVSAEMEKLINAFSRDDDASAAADLLMEAAGRVGSLAVGPSFQDTNEWGCYSLYLTNEGLPVVLRFVQIYADEFIQQLRSGEAMPAAVASGLASWLTINFDINSSLAVAAGTLIILTLGRSIGKSFERYELERELVNLLTRHSFLRYGLRDEQKAREWFARPLPPPSRRVRIFYSYAHCDESYRVQLQHALAMLRRQERILEWHDRKIIPGSDWKSKIMQELQEAAIILLLVSSDFIASDFCWLTEFEVAMHRHECGECIIIPIILRPCDWQHPPLAAMQVLPKDGKPITTWVNADEAWLDVARGIRSSIDTIAPVSCSRDCSPN